jgi:hypothetical protein
MQQRNKLIPLSLYMNESHQEEIYIYMFHPDYKSAQFKNLSNNLQILRICNWVRTSRL